MISIDSSTALIIVRIVNLALVMAWLVLALLAWRKMRQHAISGGAAFGWSLMILFLPVLGALAFLNGRPVNAPRLME